MMTIAQSKLRKSLNLKIKKKNQLPKRSPRMRRASLRRRNPVTKTQLTFPTTLPKMKFPN